MHCLSNSMTNDDASPYVHIVPVCTVPFSGIHVSWKLCPLDNASIGRCIHWTIPPLDDTSPGQRIPWTIPPLENASLTVGRYESWIARRLIVKAAQRVPGQGCTVSGTCNPRKIVQGWHIREHIVAPTFVSGDSYPSLRPSDDKPSNTWHRENEREEKERDGSWC